MRFLITGDSWSQGEWDGYPDDYRITHSGIHQYLLDDGHEVYNVGQGGFNNLESLSAITDLDFDHLIFFYTDPLRQATESEVQFGFPFDIIESHKTTLHQKLLEFKKHKNLKITLIGGCAKYLGPVQDIDYIIPSVNELIIPRFNDSEYMTSREWEIYFLKHEKNFSIKQKSQWLVVMSEAGKKYKLWNQNKNVFWPDGLHPNRHGFLIIYNFAKKLWFNE